MEKRSHCQTRKCFLPCLLTFGAPFWMPFKPKSVSSFLPRSPPSLQHPGEQQGWEEQLRGQQGAGLLFWCGSSCPRALLAGHRDTPEAFIACHAPRMGRAWMGSASPAPGAAQTRASPVPDGKQTRSHNGVFMMGCLQLSRAVGEGREGGRAPKRSAWLVGPP